MANESPKLFRAIEPLAVEYEGFTQVFNPDRVLAASHPIVRQFPDRFVAVAPHDVDMVGVR